MTIRAVLAGVAALAVGAWAADAMAQSPQAVSTRNANIWNGQDHEPDASTVRHDEQAAGIALPQRQGQTQDRELKQRGQILIDKSHTMPAPTTPVPP